MQGVTWKCDHCCLFKHISPVCISHPGEITLVNSCHSVSKHQGADVKDLRWLGCSVTLSLQSNGVWSRDNVWWLCLQRRSRVHPAVGPLRSLPALTVIVEQSLCLDVFMLHWCYFILLFQTQNVPFPSLASWNAFTTTNPHIKPPVVTQLHSVEDSQRILGKLSCWQTSLPFQRVINLSTPWFYTDEE